MLDSAMLRRGSQKESSPEESSCSALSAVPPTLQRIFREFAQTAIEQSANHRTNRLGTL